MDKKEYDNGYNDAIEAIKKMLAGKNSGSSDGANGSDSELDMPSDPDDMDGNSGSGNSGDENDGANDMGYPADANTPNKTTDNGEAENENQGVVDSKDMAGPAGASNPTGDPGDMIDKATGDKIAEKEGYDKEDGSDDQIAKDWQEKSLKAASKFKGSDPGNVISRIRDIAKTNTDWKKMLKKITGRCISEEEHEEERFTSKRRLVTRGEYARTDKDADSNDALGYIIAFVDSSGSMSDDMLRKCLREVYTVALAKKPMLLYVVQCDTKIQEITKYKNVKELEKQLKTATVKGRGGTELKPCWNLLRDDKEFTKKRKAELVMVFTDGYLTAYPRDKKTMENIYWCILDNTSFELSPENKDAHTYISYFNSEDLK